MEELAIELRICGTRSPVQRVSNNRMADEGQVDTNLVGATSFDRNLEQRHVRKSLDNVETRYRRAPGPQNRHPLPVLGIAPDRRVDRGLLIGDRTGNQSKIGLRDGTVFPL